jgi:DNA-binding HxlR family transcriptional regulator
MDPFRYDQFCPLARAAEILGHRWVLPILRELLIGPQRFSDLRRRLPGLSSSVLADRLGGLEAQGIVARRELGPPAPATVYELTPDGKALEPTLVELTRWGARFLGNSKPTDHVEPDWLGLAITAFARTDETPACRFELRPYHRDLGPNSDKLPAALSVRPEAVFRVAGGPTGTHSIDDDLPVDVSIRAPIEIMMGLMSGEMPIAAAADSADVEIDGDVEVLSELSELFSMSF